MKAILSCIKCGIEVGTQDAPYLQDGIVEGILCGVTVEEQTCGGEIKRTIVND